MSNNAKQPATNGSGNASFFERQFKLAENNTDVRTEVLAGITTFAAMAYILVVNPQVLSDPFFIMGDEAYGTQIMNGVFFATCIISFIGTLLMGLYAKVPFAQAPGMGLNAFFAYTIVLGMGYTYNQALAVVCISGLLFILISAIGLREAIVKAIPETIKCAIAPGVGLFLTIVGLKNANLVIGNSATFVGLIDFSQWGNTFSQDIITVGSIDYDPLVYRTMIASAIVALIGLVIIAVLSAKKIKGAIIIGIAVGTVIGIPFGLTKFGGFSLNIAQQFSDFVEVSLFKVDFAGLFQHGSSTAEAVFNVIMLVLAFALVNLFDTLGTLLGTARQANMLDENGEMPRMKQALLSDAIASAAGAFVGTSTATTFVESNAGIAEGGRTGLTSCVTALLFLAAIVLAPIVTIIPSAATAPALIYVGVLMLSAIKHVDFDDMTNAVPAFCTIVFMPFTYSIANGIAAGLITFVLIKLIAGKFKEINPIIVVLALLFVIRFAFMVNG